jgi:hypothetical protein
MDQARRDAAPLSSLAAPFVVISANKKRRSTISIAASG